MVVVGTLRTMNQATRKAAHNHAGWTTRIATLQRMKKLQSKTRFTENQTGASEVHSQPQQ